MFVWLVGYLLVLLLFVFLFPCVFVVHVGVGAVVAADVVGEFACFLSCIVLFACLLLVAFVRLSFMLWLLACCHGFVCSCLLFVVCCVLYGCLFADMFGVVCVSVDAVGVAFVFAFVELSACFLIGLFVMFWVVGG